MSTRGSTPRLDVAAVVRLTELADMIVPVVLRAVAELRVADHLAAGPLPVDVLATAVGADAGALLRCLRALAAREVFTEVETGVFGLTPLAQPLRGDHPLSVRDAYPLLAADIAAWGSLGHSLRTGQACFDVVHGTGYWTYLAEHPAAGARYDRSQRASTRLELRSALAALDWGSFETLVDVGGGTGAFLAGILDRHRGMTGVLVDLPHVASAAGAVLDEHGVAGRCTVVGADYFTGVPAGADAYLLKRILPGYGDADALALLRVVRAAMRPDGSVLLLEPVLEPGDAVDAGKLQDVQLAAMVGGGSRTADELTALLAAAGLRLDRVVRTMMSPIVVARPA